MNTLQSTINRAKAFLNKVNDSIARLRSSPAYLNLVDRLTQYAILARLNKPIGIYLLLWPSLWAIWIASDGQPTLSVLIIIILGTITMRSAGCVINDLADRKIDFHVERTKNRPLASGYVSVKEAILVFLVLCLIALGLVILLNPLTVKLAFIGIIFVIIYPYTKRITYLPQVFLGFTFGWAVPMAYAAQANELTKITWLLYIINILWIVAYDTIYAMVDRDDDIKLGVKSTAILFGEADISIIMLIQSMVLFSLIMLGNQLNFGICYFLGVAAAFGVVIYQYILVKNREKDKCFKAFQINAYLGFFIFMGIILHYIISLYPNNLG